MFATQFRNFERRHKFEGAALKHFESVTGCTTSTCGYFSHPLDSNYGASPDAISPGPILLEIKTRTENSTSPLKNLKGEHLFETHLQMAYAGFSYAIVESFHPEKGKITPCDCSDTNI